MDVDTMTGVEAPGYRRVAAAVAFVLPVIVVGAGAAWFIRAFIAPPMIAIPEPTVLASAEPIAPEPSAATAAEPAAAPAQTAETSGTAARQPEPAWPQPVVPAVAPAVGSPAA